MNKIQVIALSLFLFQFNFVLSTFVNLGDTFDKLMGKGTNPYYEACITNRSQDPWFKDSKFAYFFSRSLFEKYSIENEFPKENLKIPKIIHQIWLGGMVPAKYTKWIESWH